MHEKKQMLTKCEFHFRNEIWCDGRQSDLPVLIINNNIVI